MNAKSESSVLCELTQTLTCTGPNSPHGWICSNRARWPFIGVAVDRLAIAVSFRIQSALGMQKKHCLCIENRVQALRDD